MGFEVLKKDENTGARRGRLSLAHGSVETPVFMPVGTYGAVRGLSAWELEGTGSQMMLANTYHLFCRPGLETIEKLGGLHSFCSWRLPILTDSGGFQVFSLSQNRKLSDEGVEFQDPAGGQRYFFTPELVVDTQERWGSDIMMVLDECPPATASRPQIEEAVRRTSLWAARSKRAYKRRDLALFPINQGGCHLDLRKKSLEEILKLESDGEKWAGIAVGGLSVGESKADFVRTLYSLRKDLPEDRPRYLMGVGTPRDLVFGVCCGIDMFDCVIPSRNARHGIVMTREGRLNLFNQEFKEDERPIEGGCSCLSCQRYSRAFIRHLFQRAEALGQRLATLHNIQYFIRLMEEIRARIEDGSFWDFAQAFLRDPKQVYLGKEREFSDFPHSYL